MIFYSRVTGGGKLNQRQIGKEKEAAACEYLKSKGYEILAVNYRSRYSEIDIVAKNKKELVFVEVKYRKNDVYGGSMYAVDRKKRRNISRCAGYYIYRERISQDTPIRFDVIAMDGNQITHIKNAFEAVL